MITKKLNRKQTKWTEFLANFDFVIFYQTGKIHAKTNSLTRKSRDKFTSKNDDRQKHQMQTIFMSDRLNKRFHVTIEDADESEKNEPKITTIENSEICDRFERTNERRKTAFIVCQNFRVGKKKLKLIRKIHD